MSICQKQKLPEKRFSLLCSTQNTKVTQNSSVRHSIPLSLLERQVYTPHHTKLNTNSAKLKCRDNEMPQRNNTQEALVASMSVKKVPHAHTYTHQPQPFACAITVKSLGARQTNLPTNCGDSPLYSPPAFSCRAQRRPECTPIPHLVRCHPPYPLSATDNKA